jgi:asparagine synthase (glutamine-hydrolysing)
MCGICGIIYKDPSKSIDLEILKGMSDKIIHRGPDDDGYYSHRNIGLAVRRLSIIDIAGGHQPMTNESGSVVLAFNGEIYNYLELRKNLETKGHKFRSRCDTEVLVHLYEECGKNLVDHLNGMFSFAIYDRKQYRLLIARDRMGIKPLYFINTDKWMLFGSEIKTFLAFPEFDSVLDFESIHHYLTFRFVPSPRTILKGVKKLSPGSIIEIPLNNNNLKISRYWDLKFENTNKNGTINEVAEEVNALIKDAVKIRLMSEVPLGAMLSGGVDSSAIVSSMKNGSQNTISTFTIDYEEEGSHNEGKYAKLAAKAFKTDHHQIIFHFEDFIKNLGKMVYFMDEPIADPAAIPIFELCRFSKQFVTVLLSGVGGDELFAGYNVYKEAVYSKYISYIPDFLWNYLTLPLSNLIPDGTFGKNFIQRVRQPIEDYFLGSSFIYGGFSESAKAELYTDDFREYQKNYNSHNIVRSTLDGNTFSNLDKMMYIDTKHWLADSHLIMMDKMSMAHSIEARTPLLDHRLVEAVAKIPHKFKISAFNSKIALKNAYKSSIPAIIINRPKQGFSTPLQKWLNKDEGALEDLLCNNENSINKFLSSQSIKNLLIRHQNSEGDFSASIFALLILEMWLKEFL